MKKLFVIVFLLVASVLLAACSGFQETQYNFNGKTYNESDLEEHLADLLEIENSDLDIEIDIYEELDD